MAGCSCGSEVKFDGLSASYKRALWVVIAINASMFVVEFVASFIAGSRALQADALDFLGDTLTYSITLLVIGHSLKWRAGAALLKGVTLLAMAVWVFAATVYNAFVVQIPSEMIMGSVAVVALSANLISALLLMRFRNGDANVRSVWLCSRNDAINNLMVLLAAGIVYLTQSRWPDLIVAFLMSGVFLHSAIQIIRQALQEWKESDHLPACKVA
jgi:Co/Zn/Cd efflux system component